MSTSLNGNLRDFGIAEVFQLIGQQRKTGLLEISGEGEKVRLAFDEGAIIWASPVGASEFAVLGDRLIRSGLLTHSRLNALIRESEASARPLPELLVSSGAIRQEQLEEISDLLTHETIFDVMRWTGGSFLFSAQAVPHALPLEKRLAAEQILMDGLRMLDEWQSFRKWVPSEDTIFRHVGGMDAFRRKQSSPGRWEDGIDRLVPLIDGRLPARRIIDLSRLGTFEATRLLAELHQAGVIEALDEKSMKRLGHREGRARPLAQAVRWGFATALPLALLALVVFVGLSGPSPHAGAEGIPIARRPLRAAQADFDRRRLYNLLETRRFLTGSFPEELSGPDARSLRITGPLASSAPRPYYYRRWKDGFVLLPPAR